MKFFPYILHNVLRNKLRSTFTAASIAVSLFLVTVLYSYLSMQDELGKASVEYNRLVVQHGQGLTFPLPIAHVDKVRAIPGVVACTQFSWFGGKYKDDKIPFAQFGVDPQQVARVMTEFQLPPNQMAAWKNDRTGCIVGWKLFRRKGWKLGEKIPLKGDIYPVDLELTIRGVYSASSPTVDGEMLWFHWNYLDELLRAQKDRFQGNAGTIFLKVASAGQLPEIARHIDQRFASSDAPTRTMTEQAFQNMFTEMLGNVKAYIRNTALAVVFSLMCVAANAMAMSLRERTREVAVLKAIGFSRPLVLSLVLVEAMLIAMLGGLAGVLIAKAVFGFEVLNMAVLIPGFTQFYVPWSTALWGLALAAIIGLASGALPAWRAAQASVVDGLRRVV